MPCYGFKMPGGGTAIVCTGRQAQPRCKCGRRSHFQCDYPAPRRVSGTCDRFLCAVCACEVGPDRHYCQRHRAEPQADLFGGAP